MLHVRLFTNHAVDVKWLRKQQAHIAIHGVGLRFDCVEHFDVLHDFDELDLNMDRPHNREVRFGHAAGFWSIGLTDGLHIYQKER
eukprot:1004653-Heterocapsa_arctica.AAC.1